MARMQSLSSHLEMRQAHHQELSWIPEDQELGASKTKEMSSLSYEMATLVRDVEFYREKARKLSRANDFLQHKVGRLHIAHDQLACVASGRNGAACLDSTLSRTRSDPGPATRPPNSPPRQRAPATQTRTGQGLQRVPSRVASMAFIMVSVSALIVVFCLLVRVGSAATCPTCSAPQQDLASKISSLEKKVSDAEGLARSYQLALQEARNALEQHKASEQASEQHKDSGSESPPPQRAWLPWVTKIGILSAASMHFSSAKSA